jgi:hypothetical protein
VLAGADLNLIIVVPSSWSRSADPAHEAARSFNEPGVRRVPSSLGSCRVSEVS